MAVELTTLKEKPELVEATLQLIEGAFGYSENQHYKDDFISLMDERNHAHCFLLVQDDLPIAHLGVKLRELSYGEWTAPVALIGGIAVSKKEQGKGYLQSLMDHAIRKYKDDVALFILWSDLTELYAKYSFFEAGGVITTGEEKFEAPKGYKKTSFPQISDQQFKDIKELYNQRIQKECLSLNRSNEDWELLKKQSSTDLYLKVQDEKVEEYFCVGKGMDLQDIVHECSFYDEIDNPLEEQKLWIPHSPEMTYEQVHYAGFFKIGDHKRFIHFVENYSEFKLSSVAIGDHEISFILDKDNDPVILSHQDFLVGLLGPAPFKEFASFNKRLFICGLDSI